MAEKTKQFSQIFDAGVKDGIVAQIDEKVFILLIVLAAFMDKNGVCYPAEWLIAKILGKSERAIRNRITAAKKTIYRGVPVLATKRRRIKRGGKMVWSSNEYIISQPIREDLLTRYYSTGRKLPIDNIGKMSNKIHLPPAEIPYMENLPINDSHLQNNNLINDKEISPLKGKSFKEVPVAGFENGINSNDMMYCHDTAVWLGEKNMNLILSAFHNKNCGMDGIIWAAGMIKEDVANGTARDRKKLFNFYIQKYITEHSAN